MSRDEYRSLDETPFDVAFSQHEIDIARPPEQIWPHAVRIGDWMRAHVLTTVAGQVGEVGHFQQVHPRGLGDDVGEPRHHVYGIAHLIPGKLIVLQVMPERGGSYGVERPYVTFDSIHLVELGTGETRVIISMIDAQLGKDEATARSRAALIEAAHDRILGDLATLKRLAEAA